MEVLLYSDRGRMEMSTRPVPDIGEHDVLLKVAACGVCGSELEGFRHDSPRRKPPIVMGHEFCGVIEKVGSAVTGWRPGQQVVANALVTCDECVRCLRGDTHLCGIRQVFGMNRQGAFAEYVTVPAHVLFAWPEHVPAEAACLTEPLANGVHVANLLRAEKAQTAVIIGAGPIGLMSQQCLQSMLGCRTLVVDRVPERIEAATRLGAEHTAVAGQDDVLQRVKDWTGNEGADVVVDCAGFASTKQLSLECTRLGGAALWIGLGENKMELDTFPITLGERKVIGSYATHAGDMAYALQMISDGKVDVTSWIQQVPLSNALEGFKRALAAKGNDIKIVFRP